MAADFPYFSSVLVAKNLNGVAVALKLPVASGKTSSSVVSDSKSVV